MEVTAIDILHAQFKRSIRGYCVSQVDEFLRRVASTVEGYARETADLREQVDRLAVEVNRCREIETTMQNALILAQKTADELKANAHREADLILREAEQKSSQQLSEAQADLVALKAQISGLREDRDRFESELRSLIRNCSDWLDMHSTPSGSSGDQS